MNSDHVKHLNRIDDLWLDERITKRVWMYLCEWLKVALRVDPTLLIDLESIITEYERVTVTGGRCDEFFSICHSRRSNAPRVQFDANGYVIGVFLTSSEGRANRAFHSVVLPFRETIAAAAKTPGYIDIAIDFGDPGLFCAIDDEIQKDLLSVKARLLRCILPEGGMP